MAKKKYTVENVTKQLNQKINHRGNRSFATVAAALTAFAPGSRFEGQAAWIVSKRALFRFIGGTLDEHFVLDSGKIYWEVH